MCGINFENIKTIYLCLDKMKIILQIVTVVFLILGYIVCSYIEEFCIPKLNQNLFFKFCITFSF